MWTPGTTEYDMYIDNLVIASDEFADYYWSRYLIHELTMSEDAAITQAYTEAVDYIENNVASLTPGYDQALMYQNVYECIYETQYDRLFYDIGKSPAIAQQEAAYTANALAAECTDLTRVYDKTFDPCMQLAANGTFYFQQNFIKVHTNSTEMFHTDCPLIDMEMNDSVKLNATTISTSCTVD